VGDYQVREADESDLHEIAALFAAHDYGMKEVEWLRWKFLRGPWGRARMFVVCDEEGRIKGFSALLVHLLARAGTEPMLAVQGVDVFVAPEMRGRHLYSHILEFSLATVDAPRFAFPNRLSEPIVLRYGYEVLCPVRRWFFPAAFGERLRSGRFAASAKLANLCSRLYARVWLGPDNSSVEMKPVTRFETDYERRTDRFHGVRTAAFLNWRFIDNPMTKYLCFEFINRGQPTGYCVMKDTGSSVEVFDLCTDQSRRACLRKVVEYCRSRGMSHVLYPLAGPTLWSVGFVPKGATCNLLVYKTPPGRWLLTFADSDW